MFGVVLWCDEQEQKAVIWCEDHGDLAFYRSTDQTSRVELEAGDWVQFDMTMERNQRFAHNPSVVSECEYPDIAGALSAATDSKSEPLAGQRTPQVFGAQASHERGSAQIIPLVSVRSSRRQQPVGTHANRA